jgi:hypothetical protein
MTEITTEQLLDICEENNRHLLLEKIWEGVECIQKRAKARVLSKKDVELAIKLVFEDGYDEIKMDGGAVCKSYGSRAETTVLVINKKGKYLVSRGYAACVSGGRYGMHWTGKHRKLLGSTED